MDKKTSIKKTCVHDDEIHFDNNGKDGLLICKKCNMVSIKTLTKNNILLMMMNVNK